jgi:hypothetical protein
MAFEVVEIQPTPNPNAAKFVVSQPIADQPTSFFHADAAKDHPIASRLFGIPGVTSVLLLGDFVTVNKDPAAPWERINRRVREVLKES